MSADIPDVPVEILPLLKHRPELSICGIKAPTPEPSLSVHYRCKSCPYGTNIQQHAQNHEMEHIFCQKEFFCPVCGQAYESENRMQHHRQSHEDISPYVCIYCEKRFRNPTSLRNHMELHFPVEMSCETCNKKFISSRALRRHVLRVHSNESSYPK